MSATNTRFAYTDCFEAWELAREDSKGIRIPFKSFDDASAFRARMHYARTVDRKDNEKLHQPTDLLFGRSSYDSYVVRIRQDTEDGGWVYIEPLSIDVERIENLSELESK